MAVPLGHGWQLIASCTWLCPVTMCSVLWEWSVKSQRISDWLFEWCSLSDQMLTTHSHLINVYTLLTVTYRGCDVIPVKGPKGPGGLNRNCYMCWLFYDCQEFQYVTKSFRTRIRICHCCNQSFHYGLDIAAVYNLHWQMSASLRLDHYQFILGCL